MGAKIFEIYGEVDVQDNALDRKLKTLDKNVDALGRSIDNLEGKARKVGKTNAVTARQFAKMRDRVQESNRELQSAVSKYKKGEISGKQLGKAVEKAGKSQRRLASAIQDSNARLTDFAQRAKKAEQRARSLARVGAHMRQLGDGMANAGRSLTAGVTLPLAGLATVGTKTALEMDRVKTTMTALTGSTSATNAKWIELNKISDRSVGVLRSVAREQFVQLKAMKVGDDTINKMITSMGKLNAVFQIDDMQGFTQNLNQIFKQGFERADIKEAIGRVPIFEELLEKKFGTAKGAELKKLKESGKLTLDGFLSGITEAIDSDDRLNVADSLASKFAKASEKFKEALAPVGKVLLDAFVPILDKVGPVITRLSEGFASLPRPVQTAIVGFAGLVASIGPVLLVAGTLVAGLSSIVTAVGALVGVVGGAGPAVAILGGAFLAIGPILAQLAVPLGAVTLGIIALRKAWADNTLGIQDRTRAIWAQISSLIGDATKEIGLFVGSMWSVIQSFWKENGADISKATAKIVSFILDLWDKHGEKVINVVKAMWKAVSGLVKFGIFTVLNIIKAVTAVINGDWDKFWDALSDITKDAWTQIKTAIKAGISIAENLFWGFLGFMDDLGTRLAKKMLSIGKDIVNGLIDGIEERTPDAKTAMIYLINPLAGIARSALQSKSPSKVFKNIGEDIVNGLIEGIKHKSEKAKEATRKLFTQVIDVFKEIGFIQEPTLMDKVFGMFKDPKLAPAIEAVAKKLKMSVERLKMLSELSQIKLEPDTLGGAVFAGAGRGGGTGIGSGMGFGNEPLDMSSGTLSGTVTEQLGPPPRLVPEWENFWQTMKGKLGEFADSLPSVKEAIGFNLIDSISTFGDIVANSFEGMLNGGKNFFKGMIDGTRQMVNRMIADLLRLLVIKTILGFASMASGGSFSAGFSGGGSFSSILGGGGNNSSASDAGSGSGGAPESSLLSGVASTATSGPSGGVSGGITDSRNQSITMHNTFSGAQGPAEAERSARQVETAVLRRLERIQNSRR